MKILAIEHENQGIEPGLYAQFRRAEAIRAWELYQSGLIRELYFRQDRSQAVLMLECDSVVDARKVLQSLPLVQAGLIDFELIPLVAYPGFGRLFATEG